MEQEKEQAERIHAPTENKLRGLQGAFNKRNRTSSLDGSNQITTLMQRKGSHQPEAGTNLQDQNPSSPALHSLIWRTHSDLRTCEALMRREGFGSRIE